MSKQDSDGISLFSTRRSAFLWGALLTATTLACLLAATANAQLSGTWDIIVDDCCTDPDGETSCGTEGLSIEVTQNGNRLSGSLFLPEEIPPECNASGVSRRPLVEEASETGKADDILRRREESKLDIGLNRLPGLPHSARA